MKELPTRIICQATIQENPVQGIMLRASFSTISKNPYNFICGPTNHDGCAVMTKEEILRRAESQLELAIMDYVPLAGGFAGHIAVMALSRKEIEGAISAYAIFKNFAGYPNNYQQNLENALTNPALDQSDQIRVKLLQ